MYDLCVFGFTCIKFIFVFHGTHVRMSYVLTLTYLLTYLLTGIILYLNNNDIRATKQILQIDDK